MSINSLIDDLENTLGLHDNDDEFIQQISRDLQILIHGDALLNELPTLEKELDRHKSMLATAETEKAALVKEFDAKTAALAEQTAKQMLKLKEVERIEQEKRQKLEQEKQMAQQEIEKLKGEIAQQKAVSIKRVAVSAEMTSPPSVTKSSVIELQKKATDSMEKCRSVQALLQRHATVYGKKNEQYKKLQIIYKEEKEALARHVIRVRDATAQLEAPSTVIRKHKIESVF